jgi:hypothetical protein
MTLIRLFRKFITINLRNSRIYSIFISSAEFNVLFLAKEQRRRGEGAEVSPLKGFWVVGAFL